jgi:transposase-like protein
VYPQGVTRAQQSDRLKGQTILLYTLGIRYRGVEDFLETFDHCVDHTTVYRNVQAAGEAARQLGRVWLHQLRGKVAVVGSDLTYVRCRGEQVAIAVAVDDAEGMMLDIELLDDEERETVKGWLPPLLSWSVRRRCPVTIRMPSRPWPIPRVLATRSAGDM